MQDDELRMLMSVMQYIQQNSVALAVFALSYLTALCAWKGHRICQHKLIRLLLFYNPLTLYLCLHYWATVVLNVVIISVVLFNEQQPNLIATILASAIIGSVCPVLMPVVAISYIGHFSLISRQMGRISNRAFVVMLLVLGLVSVYWANYDQYFSTQFSKNSGLMWLLYSHVFQRYLFMYQTILTLIPFLICLPLALLDCPLLLKIAVLYFSAIFTMPAVSLAHLLTLFCLEMLAYHPIMACLNPKGQITWNILSIMLVVIATPTYILYERTVELWTHTHMVSVGYFLLQILLFWGVHVVYLAEGLGLAFNQGQTSEETQKKQKLLYSMVRRLLRYSKERVAEM